MQNNIFVSYDYNDRAIVHSIHTLAKQATSNGWNFVFVVNDVARNYFTLQERDRNIYNEINRVMSTCSCALFAIGNNVHNSPWISKEIELAKSKNLIIGVTRVPGTTGGVPAGLMRYNILQWSPFDIFDHFNYEMYGDDDF